MQEKPLIFSTSTYRVLANRITDACECSKCQKCKPVMRSTHFELGQLEHKVFPDGERYHRLISKVNDREVILLGGTINDLETMELFDLANAVVRYGAANLKVVIPYFGYSTMERARKVKGDEAAINEVSREDVKAKNRALLLSAIPKAQNGNRFYLLDLHVAGLADYFQNCLTTEIYAEEVVVKAAKDLASAASSQSVEKPKFVFGATDAGRMKWVTTLAERAQVEPVFAYKHRVDGNTVQSLGISGPVKGNYVVLYDDMIRTGGSLITAAEGYKKAGTKGMSVVATHGVFPPGAWRKLRKSKLFDKVVVTDSHPNALLAESESRGFVKVVSIAPLLARRLMCEE